MLQELLHARAHRGLRAAIGGDAEARTLRGIAAARQRFGRGVARRAVDGRALEHRPELLA